MLVDDIQQKNIIIIFVFYSCFCFKGRAAFLKMATALGGYCGVDRDNWEVELDF